MFPKFFACECSRKTRFSFVTYTVTYAPLNSPERILDRFAEGSAILAFTGFVELSNARGETSANASRA